VTKISHVIIFLAGINIALATYHLLIVKPMIEMVEIERGAYIMDVEGLTAFKAAQLVREYQAGRVDLATPEGIQAALGKFRSDLGHVLKETVGNAPVFQPKAVVNAEGFIDVTPLVARRLNIDFKQNYADGSADYAADFPSTPE
jgi:hypothetical protein